MKSNLSRFVLGSVLSLSVGYSAQAQSVWTGAANSVGNWSSTTAPGWTSGGVPNSVGATATMTQSNNSTVTQDIGAGVTVGTFSRSGAGSTSVFTATLNNSITFNQDGAGAGTATISNASSLGTSTTGVVFTGTGNLILADDLLIINTATANTRSGGAISIAPVISGTGNVTISNATTTVSAGAIRLTGANTFTGSVTVRNGGVSFNDKSAFGNAANILTLGASGQGDVNVQASAATSGNIANNIVVAAGTGGTTTLGSFSTAASGNNTFAGTVLLNGNLSVTSSYATGGRVIFSNVISGAGNLTKIGTGEVRLSGLNTYTGNTTVSAGTLNLADNAQMHFVIGANGVNNHINGTGTLTLDGDFTFDLTGAASVGSWTIVDVASLVATFSSSFTVVGFTDNLDNTWTSGNYTFSEATGVLTAVPEPSSSLMVLGGLTMFVFMVRRRRQVS